MTSGLRPANDLEDFRDLTKNVSDTVFFAELKKVRNPKLLLAIILDSEPFLTGDPYYSDIQQALFNQIEVVLKNET